MAVNAIDMSNPDLLVQQDEDQSAGVEIEAAGEIFPNLSVTLSYAHDIAKVLQSTVANEIGTLNAPRNASGSWVKYTFMKGFAKNITLQAGHSQAGQRNTLKQGLILPAYCIFDAVIGYRFKKLSAVVNMYNVGNTIYWT